MTKFLLGALALTLSSTAFAAEPAPAPKKECCCKKDEQGKMACCKDKAGDEHAGHDMGSKAPK